MVYQRGTRRKQEQQEGVLVVPVIESPTDGGIAATGGRVPRRRIMIFNKVVVCGLVSVLSVWSLTRRPTIDVLEWKKTVDASKRESSDMIRGQPARLITTWSSPPPPCTTKQRETIQAMLPDNQTLKVSTNCPDHTWMEDSVPGRDEISSVAELPILWEVPQASSRTNPPTAIFVGCNKALDAVDTLRMLSLDPKYDKWQWKGAMGITESVCGQHKSPQFSIDADWPRKLMREAQVYCIEAMPSTFAKLDRTAKQLGWQNSLRVFHAALADDINQTSVLFPNAVVGTEYLGIQDCLKPKFRKNCEDVPLMTLDAFVQAQHLTGDIDYLSIDVEGNDWPVLKGASQVTLPRVKYLEFEYHNVGKWKEYKLKPVIDALQEQTSDGGGFVCYWAGRGGKLWRISDCWLDHYDELKEWSNVACVNWKRAPTLAARMEARFLQTIQDYEYLQKQLYGQVSR